MRRLKSTTAAPSAQVPCAIPVSAGPDPFQREHEIADALVTLLIAHSRYGAGSDADRLGLIMHITIIIAHEIGERVARLRGNDAARAFRRALARKEPKQ